MFFRVENIFEGAPSSILIDLVPMNWGFSLRFRSMEYIPRVFSSFLWITVVKIL